MVRRYGVARARASGRPSTHSRSWLRGESNATGCGGRSAPHPLGSSRSVKFAGRKCRGHPNSASPNAVWELPRSQRADKRGRGSRACCRRSGRRAAGLRTSISGRGRFPVRTKRSRHTASTVSASAEKAVSGSCELVQKNCVTAECGDAGPAADRAARSARGPTIPASFRPGSCSSLRPWDLDRRRGTSRKM